MDVPPVGEVIGVAANELAGRTIGGRVSAVNGRNITLDRAADVKAGNRLFLNLPSGTAQARTVQAVNGNTVTVTTPYSETPEAECNWGVDSDDLFIALFRVTGTRDNNDGTFEVTGTTYNPDIYSAVDTGARLDERPVSVIPPGVQAPPGNIVVDSYSTVNQNIAITTMRVAWDAVQGAVAYEAEWRRDSGNWISVPRTSSLGFEVQGIYSGRYLVRVRAVNASDVSSVWATSPEVNLTGKVGNPPKPVGFIASENVVFGIELSWGFPANTDDTLKTEIQYSLTGTEDDAMLLADVPYPQRKYQQMGLKAGQIFWYRAQLVDRSGNESGYTDFVRGQASIDVSDITDAILEEIKETDTFKDMIENAVDSSGKLAELADAIKENADGLAAAVGSNKQTAEAIIGNALAIADVVVRQTAQQGANSATFEQLREVIATETEARVTDVTRLEAKTEQNEAGITEVRQALSDETQARATAVDQLTASTQVISDKADSASSKADAASGKADAAEQASSQNTADITTLRQVVTDTTSSMASRLEELGARTDTASGGIQNNAIALITSTLAQVDQRVRLSAQYGDSKAGIDRIDNVMASDREATARSLLSLQADVNGNKASINSLNQTFSDYQQATATQINGITATINGHTSAITTNAQAIANVNGDLKAMYSIKVGLSSNGQYYAAGMGIGVENTPSGMQSQVIFLADRFAVTHQAGATVTLPFVIQNGQVFIRETFIQDGTIGTGTEDDAMLLADVPYPQRKYQQMGLKAGQTFWYRAQLVDRSGNESGYTDFVRGQASIDVSDITDAILEEIKDSEVFKDLIESAVDSNEKLAELSDAIKENADGLAAAVGSNKQTAEAIIGNALAIADVIVRQTAQQGANSATFEQLREVIATETEARVTDVTRLEAKTAQNEAGVTEVRQALSDEAQARATAVDQLTASTQVISDKADSASSKADAASGKADAAEQVSSQNTADITTLRQVVTDTTSSMASRLEELGARTDTASGGIQNNAIALITSTLAQVDQQVRLSAQYGDSKASIDRIDNVMASDREATARSLLSVQAEVNGNKASINSLNQTFSDYQQATATQINGITATINGHTSAITTNAQAIANVNGDLKAMYSIKVGLSSNGQYYAAGMGIGVENTPSGMQSQVIFLADRFAVTHQAGATVTLPFVIQNGQVFIRETFIQDGTIGNAKIGNYIQSNNYVAGSVGWRLDKGGTFENYGSTAGEGAMKQTNQTISVKDANNVLRVQIGRITGTW
ncbi:gp24 [Enterobacter hormaechei]|nr:gp24 [Enterobacter hormaechei]